MQNTTSQKIYSHSAKQYWQIWLIALVWNVSIGFVIVKGGQDILTSFTENPILYLFILLPLIGIWFIFNALQRTLAWYKFGKVPITLNPPHGVIGGSCSGYMLIPISVGNAQQADISLSCIRHYVSSKNNGKRRHYTKLIWQNKIATIPETDGEQNCLNFAFTPPHGLPESGQRSDDYHVWTINIRIPLSGISFDRSYEVPIENSAE